jgi:cyclic pyranopterin phosphate synthase
VSALQHERTDWRSLDVDAYYAFAKERGATRLVITGGGEPLLRPDDVVYLIERGNRYFEEIACFTNGTFLTRERANQLRDAGLSYLCYSRHAATDDDNRKLMGEGAPRIAEFMEAASAIKVRATCVMARGSVEDSADVWEYIDALRPFGIREFTFKHTYVAYEDSLFQSSAQNAWAREHKVEFDPFGDEGEVIATLPWGPRIRRIRGVQACYYHEPTPQWERANAICRSSNLLSDGSVFASLEETSSLLFRLPRSSPL